MQDELIVAIAIFVLVVIAIAIARRQRHRRPSTASTDLALAASEPAAPPARTGERARKAALGALDALDLPPGRERALQLATIARRYFTDAHGIAALSATTAELHEMLRRHDLSDDTSRALVDAIDAARFGGPSAIRDLEDHLRTILTR